MWYWKSAILSTAPRICQHDDIWPIRAWYQNLVSWNGGIKGISPGSAALSPSPGYRSACFARRCFSYLTPFLPFSPTAEPVPRLKIKGELRAILRLLWTALKTNWCKKMRIDNTALKLARFIHIMLRKNVLNSWQFPEYSGIFFDGLKSQGISKKFHLYIAGKIYWLLPGI